MMIVVPDEVEVRVVQGTIVVSVLVSVIWEVVPFAGAELVDKTELVVAETTLLLDAEVVTGTELVLMHPPLQLVIVWVEVVYEVMTMVDPLETTVLVRGQTVVVVKIVMSLVVVVGPAGVVVLVYAVEVLVRGETIVEVVLADEEIVTAEVDVSKQVVVLW